MYDRILLPTDGSVGTAHVALQAFDLAGQYGATVHVFHVVDEDVRSLVDGLADAEDELADRGRRAVERLEAMAREHDVAVETAIREGHPADAILDYADEIAADLIVAGTHARTGIERRILGSVAERLVRQADCPVMTIRLPESDVTVEDADDATAVARRALDDEGIDASVAGTERQVSVWALEADGPDGAHLVYVDPVTRRTSVIRQE